MPSEAWRRKKLVKDLVVVGHGRGATSYAAYWLQAQGIMVEHERLGPQGIVESGFSVPTWGVRGGMHQGLTRDQFTFKNRIAILRDPYKVIGTYEQVEHPRAIFTHVEHLPNMLDGLLPAGWDALDDDEKIALMENDRPLRVRAITRSVIQWTESGIEWAGEWMRAEEQWEREMPYWLEAKGLWQRDSGEPYAVEKNTVNHRKGRRLTRDEINDMLSLKVKDELAAYCERYGYA